MAGAIGVLVIPPTPGLVYIDTKGLLAPAVFTESKYGQLIMDTIAAGPATIKGPTSKPFAIPASREAGQLSYFSSMGPDPYLELSPHVLAPGGNVYSTYPIKHGGYMVLSGTSMSCPYVAGAIALLKEARPNLTVSEIDEILSVTAKPLVSPATGSVEHPYKGGAGLINIYDAIKSRVTIDPPRISIKNTTQGAVAGFAGMSLGDTRWTTCTIMLTNTDKSNDMRVSIGNTGSASLSMYFRNGSIAYMPLTFGGNNWPVEPENTLPTIQVFDTPNVPAGQTQEYTMAIIAPKALNNTDKLFFGGTVDFKLQWGNETTTSIYSVPYAGLNGDYTKLDVLAPLDSGYPMLSDIDGNPLDPAKLVVGEVLVYVQFSMAIPSHLGIVQLVNSTNDAVGYIPGGYMDYVPHTCPTCSPPVLQFELGRTIFTDEGLTNSVQAPAGKYHIHAAFLRPLGDEGNSDDFQVWDSQAFTIA
ncbi:hypothetical protein IW140_005648 [Coemansia sp. RSA 1813]|nr:hypothetical protein IW138_005786 [Coemansia sp. RSA 986]KAJ2564704.1 hypothetical protein IW140_005648 [Coemansia sp. RSA 1813]